MLVPGFTPPDDVPAVHLHEERSHAFPLASTNWRGVRIFRFTTAAAGKCRELPDTRGHSSASAHSANGASSVFGRPRTTWAGVTTAYSAWA